MRRQVEPSLSKNWRGPLSDVCGIYMEAVATPKASAYGTSLMSKVKGIFILYYPLKLSLRV